MNLELLDPFRRQIPDRVIATLSLPPSLHGINVMSRNSMTGGTNNVNQYNGKHDQTSEPSKATAMGSTSSLSASVMTYTGASGSTSTVGSSSYGTKKSSAQQAAAAAAAALMMEEEEWKAVYHVAFNRRGSYVAVGYASGTVAVYDMNSRTLAALYRDSVPPSSSTSLYSPTLNDNSNAMANTGASPSSTSSTPPSTSAAANHSNSSNSKPLLLGNGVTSVTWSRRSRTLLAGAVGDAHVRLMDTTHPAGPEECCSVPPPTTSTNNTTSTLQQQQLSSSSTHSTNTMTASSQQQHLLGDDLIREGSSHSHHHHGGDETIIDDSYWGPTTNGASSSTTALTSNKPPTSSLAKPDRSYDFVSNHRYLPAQQLHQPQQMQLPQPRDRQQRRQQRRRKQRRQSLMRRYPTVVFSFPHPVGGSLQVHPRESTAGLAVLSNGSLVVFLAPPTAWDEDNDKDVEDDQNEAEMNNSDYEGNVAHGSDDDEMIDDANPETTFLGASTHSNTIRTAEKQKRRSSSMTHESEAIDDNNEEYDRNYDHNDYHQDSLGKKQQRSKSSRASAIFPQRRSLDQLKSLDSHTGTTSGSKEKKIPEVQLVTIWENHHYITCAAFDPHGERIYAAAKDGTLMGFEVKHIFESMKTSRTIAATSSSSAFEEKANDTASAQHHQLQKPNPSFRINIPGGSMAWHLIVSRNGGTLIINSADGALRLYSTAKCWTTPELVERPNLVFQDVVSKVKFASCDISGDGEYVVGGANGNVDNKYELYIWNTTTGVLLDKLTGPPVQLYSVAWHPTRNFLAVAASDGLVDIWGPPINWTAFAPDFQALPANVEYIEREDEFDIPFSTSYTSKHRNMDQDAKAVGEKQLGRVDDEEENDCDEKEEEEEVVDGDTDVIWDDKDDEKKDATVEDRATIHYEDDDDRRINEDDWDREDEVVDVVTVKPIPVFASDSEDEGEAFTFQNKVHYVKGGFRGRYKKDAEEKD